MAQELIKASEAIRELGELFAKATRTEAGIAALRERLAEGRAEYYQEMSKDELIEMAIAGDASKPIRIMGDVEIFREWLESCGIEEEYEIDADSYRDAVAELREIAAIKGPKRKPSISAENEIVSFFHCGSCLGKRPKGTSPKDWSKVQVGFTVQGIQVWCNRCELNVCHIDFQGYKHPANLEGK
jgi:hypothetical protein